MEEKGNKEGGGEVEGNEEGGVSVDGGDYMEICRDMQSSTVRVE